MKLTELRYIMSGLRETMRSKSGMYHVAYALRRRNTWLMTISDFIPKHNCMKGTEKV